LHSVLLTKYHSDDQIQQNVVGGAYGVFGGGGRGSAYRVLEGRPEERRLLGRRRRGLDYNIKVDLQGEEWVCMDLIDLVMDKDGW
jgi:hypothetical protein